MLIVFLLVLSTAKVNSESINQDGLRKPRQQSLSLQDIQTAEEFVTTIGLSSTSKDGLLPDYLPPGSPLLSAEEISSQSQQTFNSVPKGNELCKSFSNNELCNFKDSSTSDSKIPKPSRDLVPPFKNFEQGNKKIKATTRAQKTFSSTTEKPVTKFFKHETNRKFTRPKPTALKLKVLGSKVEATNELRSYLPPQPEFSAAAQTNVAVVQPSDKNNRENSDSHHDHHHKDNVNICEDAFHSFLCAPLKARKRITGALPIRLLGESSFINYQKALSSFDRETAPSTALKNNYLPPNPSSSNLIQSTYLPPSTSNRPVVTSFTTVRPYSSPKVIPESSNLNNKVYLPPVTGSTKSPLNFASSVAEYSTTKFITPKLTTAPTRATYPTSTLTPPAFRQTTPSVVSSSFLQNASSARSTFNSILPTIPIFKAVPSNENTYLPPPNPQPSASFVSNLKSPSSVISTLLPTSASFSSLPPITSSLLPINSIDESQKPIIQSTLSPFISTSSFASTPSSLISVSPLVTRPSNREDSSYLPPLTQFQYSSGPSTTTIKPYSSTFKFAEQPSKTDLSYLPPDNREPAAAQINSDAVAAPENENPFHHGRDLCTDPFHSFLCASAKPRKKITGDFPLGFKPESSKTEELRLKAEPSSQDENKFSPNSGLVDSKFQSAGYNYPKPVGSSPSNIVPSSVPAHTDYSFSNLDKEFSSSSQQNGRLVPTSSTKKPEPVFQPSEAKATPGYQYPKPDKIFLLPGGEENSKVVSTISSPTTGYSYPRPQKPFPLPTEQNEVRQKPTKKTPTSPQPSISFSTNQTRGYQYPKPDESLNLPERKGYTYSKPEKRLELPGESRSKFLLPQNSSFLNGLGNLGSADFIPVNKIEFKRAESSKLLAGLRRFGERMKKRERQAQLLKRQ